MEPALPTVPEILRREGYSTQAYVSHFMLDEANGLARGNPHGISSAKQITTLALAGMRRTEVPFFIWAHYFDPHFAYQSHPGFSLFGEAEADLYDQEIAYTDQQIGGLLDELDLRHTIVIFTADHGEEFGEHSGRYHCTLYDEVIRTSLILKAPALEPGSQPGIAEQIDILPTLLGLLRLSVDAPLPGRDLLDSKVEDGPAPSGWLAA